MNSTEKRMVRAVKDGRNFCAQNTRVRISYGNKYAHVYLFDNHIATVDRTTWKVWFNRCGWNTNTTKNRMIALGYASLHIHNGEICSVGGWYENGLFTLAETPNAKCRFVDEDLSVFLELDNSEADKLAEIERKKNSLEARYKRSRRELAKNENWWKEILFKV